LKKCFFDWGLVDGINFVGCTICKMLPMGLNEHLITAIAELRIELDGLKGVLEEYRTNVTEPIAGKSEIIEYYKRARVVNTQGYITMLIDFGDRMRYYQLIEFIAVLEAETGLDFDSLKAASSNYVAKFIDFQRRLKNKLNVSLEYESFSGTHGILKRLLGLSISEDENRLYQLLSGNKDYIPSNREPPIWLKATIGKLTREFENCENCLLMAADLFDQISIRINIESPEQKKPNNFLLDEIFNNFHAFAKQLKNRHSGKEPFVIETEYDVQDLLRAILHLHFEIVVPEEWTPSYAGSAARMDFILENEQTAIEVKKTRDTLNDKKIGEELLVDIAKYKKHPKCSTLYCFVYDPDEVIKNPKKIIADLAAESNEAMQVKVFIKP
jgi:REase_DpnII-MboI